MTIEWKERVRARLQELGKNQAWLARELGASRAQITQMLGDQTASVYVPAACELLQIEMPMHVVREDDVSLLDDLSVLEPEDKQLIRDFIARLKAARQTPKK